MKSPLGSSWSSFLDGIRNRPGAAPTLNQVLTSLGLESRPSPQPSTKVIADASGSVLFIGDAGEVWQWLRARAASQAISDLVNAARKRPGLTADCIICPDGFRVSIQASSAHYSTPTDSFGPWTRFEVGHPSEAVESLMPFIASEDAPTEAVYGYVPAEVVLEMLESHGLAVAS